MHFYATLKAKSGKTDTKSIFSLIYKTMKTSLNILGLIALLTFFNCSSKKDDPTPSIEFEKQIKLISTLSIWNQPTIVNSPNAKDIEKTHYSTTGVSYAMKLSKFRLEMSHVARETSLGASLSIQNGYFEILSEEGDSVFGSYEGLGDLAKEKLALEFILKVEGGNGYYANASGYIEMKTRVYEPHASALFFELDGFIIRDKAALEKSLTN